MNNNTTVYMAHRHSHSYSFN